MTNSTSSTPDQLLFVAYNRAALDSDLRATLRAIDVTFTIEHSDASSDPVWFGEYVDGSDAKPTVKFVLRSTCFAQRFWAGEEPLVPALVSGQLKIYGPVNRILELVNVLPRLFAILAD